MEELINLLLMEHCKSKEDFLELREKAFAMFDKLSKEEQEILVEDNVFESLSMVISAYEYEDEQNSRNNDGHQ
ncbi:MAG: hypothetical protein NC548_60485 [Lachnospiraceae bacterium]|nr:hypothetical protein [Lachnospiraceae bacterium]